MLCIAPHYEQLRAHIENGHNVMPNQQFGRDMLYAVVWYGYIVDAGYINTEKNKIHWHCFADLAAVAELKHPKTRHNRD